MSTSRQNYQNAVLQAMGITVWRANAEVTEAQLNPVEISESAANPVPLGTVDDKPIAAPLLSPEQLQDLTIAAQSLRPDCAPMVESSTRFPTLQIEGSNISLPHGASALTPALKRQIWQQLIDRG